MSSYLKHSLFRSKFGFNANMICFKTKKNKAELLVSFFYVAETGKANFYHRLIFGKKVDFEESRLREKQLEHPFFSFVKQF